MSLDIPRRSEKVSFAVMHEHSKVMESFGVITVQSSRVSEHCAACDHASAQYPVTGAYFALGTVQLTLVSH